MKTFLSRYGLLSALLLAFIAVFALGGVFSRYMSAQIPVHSQEQLDEQFTGVFGAGNKAIRLDETPVEKSYTLSDERGDFSPILVSAYEIFQDQTALGVVYVIESHGEASGLVIAYAIDFSTDDCIGAAILSSEESTESLEALTDEFYAQFSALTLDTLTLAVVPAPEAGYTSEGFEIGLLFAREQYMVDFDFEISQDSYGMQFLTMFEGATSAESFQASALVKEYLLPSNDTFAPTIDSAWKIYSGDVVIGAVYVVNSHGKNIPMQLAFAFSVADNTSAGVMVLVQNETPSFYSTLSAAFFSQFYGASLSDLNFGVDGVAGATYSSQGFNIGWLYAREVYALDFNFTIPTVQLSLVDLHYNFDPETFVASPFVADIVHGSENTGVSVYLNSSFEYVGVAGEGDGLNADEQAYLKTLASQDGSVSTKAYFLSYDSGTRQLVMEAKGYSNRPITVTMTLNASLDGIESFSVVSEQTYDDEYNMDDYGNYTGGPVPAVENHFMTEYQTSGEVPIDSVAGASQGTSPAMRALIGLLDLFLDHLNGGE